MKFEILNSDSDIYIKNDLYKFLDGVYISSDLFTEEENDYALKLSFLFNHSIIEEYESTYDKLVFTYGGKYLKISLDNSNVRREEYFKYMMDEEFFQNSLKTFIRDYRINKIIE
jgi:hypothetical protein